MSIEDNGTGLSRDDSQLPVGHYGLIGMRERAHQIRATLVWLARPGGGTIVQLVLPNFHGTGQTGSPAFSSQIS